MKTRISLIKLVINLTFYNNNILIMNTPKKQHVIKSFAQKQILLISRLYGQFQCDPEQVAGTE